MQEEIGSLKEGLVVERKKRHNKEIYEEACKDINKYPPHLATKASNHDLAPCPLASFLTALSRGRLTSPHVHEGLFPFIHGITHLKSMLQKVTVSFIHTSMLQKVTVSFIY